jgi:hypothetical protein
VTAKEWKAARWYLVGQWVAPNRIEWLGGGETNVKFTKSGCTSGQGVGQLVRLGAKGVVQTLEVLERDAFVAIELSPAIARERFEFRSPQFGSDPSCKSEVSISYNWSGKSGDFRPFLALTAQNNRYSGYVLQFATPETEASRMDIQLDLSLGVAQSKLPNAQGGAESILLAPVAVSRGEWMIPGLPVLGLEIGLEQSIANLGAPEDSFVLFSEWMAGVFYEHTLFFGDGLVLRGHLRYHQRRADDSRLRTLVAEPNKDAKVVGIVTQARFYYLQRWMSGVVLEYGPALSLAGRGEAQGLLAAKVQFGYRMNPTLSLILESGYRQFTLDQSKSESELQLVQAGVRLSL